MEVEVGGGGVLGGLLGGVGVSFPEFFFEKRSSTQQQQQRARTTKMAASCPRKHFST